MGTTRAGLVAMPLHIVDGLDVLHSFGRMAGLDAPGNAHRVLAVDRPEAHLQRAIRRLSHSGMEREWPQDSRAQGTAAERPGTITRMRFSGRVPTIRRGSHRTSSRCRSTTATAGRTLGDQFGSQGDWQDRMEYRVMPNGRVAYGPIDDDTKAIYEMRIDLIDLSHVPARSSLPAVTMRCSRPWRIVRSGLIIETVENERNYPQMVVWRLGLRRVRGRSPSRLGDTPVQLRSNWCKSTT